MKTFKNVAYGSEKENLLDIYLPEENPKGTIVYFHGGGLADGKKDEKNYVEIAKSFTDNGYGFVSVDYRMYPTAKFPDYIEDAAKAVGFISREIQSYGGNKKLIVSGQSAGAWISLMLCLNGEYLKKEGMSGDMIADWIIDSAQTTAHFNVISQELGADGRKQMINEYAPIYFVDEKNSFSRMLLICYENDMPCRPEQNELFLKAVLAFNPSADIKLVKLPGEHCHGSTRKDEDGEYAYVKESLKWLE